MPIGANHLLRFGPYQLDTQCGQLRKNGFGVKLQGQPVQILEILLEHPGELVTREELRQRLWTTDTFVDFDHSLNTAIKRLRQALGDDAETPKYIETIPKRGYRFVGEVEHAGAFAATTPPSSPPETFPTTESPRGTTPTSRGRKAAILVCLSVMIVLLAIGYWFFQPIPQPHIVASHALTKTGFRKEGRLLTDGRNIYFKEWKPSGPVLMQVSTKGGEVAQLSALPIRTFDFATDISKDGAEMLVMVETPDATRWDTWSQPLPAGPPRLLITNALAPFWTADGQNILFVRREASNGVLYRANADGSAIRRLAELPGLFVSVRLLALAISPDGSRIRFGVGHSVWEASSNGTNAHEIVNRHGGWFGAWSPEGKYYFFKSWDGPDLWAISDAGWSHKRPEPVKLTFGPFWVGAPTVSKDGKEIYAIATEQHGELSIYDSKSGQFVPHLGGIPACYVDFSRDGQWITYVSFPEGDLWRSRVDGSERRQLTWPPYAVTNPRWSPEGKLIAFNDISGGDRDRLGESSRIYVVSADGGQPIPLATSSSDNEVGDATWSPDGRAVAYSVGGPLQGRLGEIRILDLQTQTSSKVPGSDGLWSPRWSPDGDFLVAFRSRFANKLMLFSFATQQWRELSSSANVFGWPSWTRDSKHVILHDNRRLVRIDVFSGRKEHITDTGGLRTAGYAFDRIGWGWFGLTPDDRPITMRDTGVEEIYAFDLEYK